MIAEEKARLEEKARNEKARKEAARIQKRVLKKLQYDADRITK